MSDEDTKHPPRYGRHWAVPVFLLAILVGLQALAEGGPAVLFAGLLLIAAGNIWAGLGRRRPLGVDGFIHASGNSRFDLIMAGISLCLSIFFLLGFAGALAEFRTASVADDDPVRTQLEETLARMTGDDAPEATAAPSPEAPSPEVVEELFDRMLDDIGSEMARVQALNAVYDAAMRDVMSEMEGVPTQERFEVLSTRVNFLVAQFNQICLILHAETYCPEAGYAPQDVLGSAVERDAVLSRLERNLAEIEGWK